MNFNNIIKGPITTLIGLLLAVGTIYSVLFQEVTWAEAAIPLGIALVCLGLKDPKPPMNLRLFMLYITILAIGSGFLLQSCKRPVAVSSSTETKTITYKDTLILVRGDSAKATFKEDSILKVLRELQLQGKRPEVIVESKKGDNQLIYRLNQLSQLEVACISKDRMIEFLIKQVEVERSKVKEHIIEVTPKWVWPVIISIATVLTIILFIKK